MTGAVLILGGGTAGRVAANRLRRRLDRDAWHITVVDADDEHVYRPGPLMVRRSPPSRGFGGCAGCW